MALIYLILCDKQSKTISAAMHTVIEYGG